MAPGLPRTVVLTRPAGRQDALLRQLREAGLSCLDLPALEVSPRVPTSPWPAPQTVDLVVFVSRQAVHAYFQAMPDLAAGWPPGVTAAAVGGATAAALRVAGVPTGAIMHPPAESLAQDSEALWALLQSHLANWRRVLIVRGEHGREWLGQQFEAAGLSVVRLPVYRRHPARWRPDQDAALVAAVQEGAGCRILLTSREGVDAFYAQWCRLGLDYAWARQHYVVTHPHVAAQVAAVSVAALPADALVVVPPDDPSLWRVLSVPVFSANVLQSRP